MIFRNFSFFCCMIIFSCTLWAAPSPWDSWRSGYTTFEKADAIRERGNYTEALRLFEKAKNHYLAVRKARPDWNQRVIAERISDCDKKISEMKRLLQSGTPASTPRSTASSPASGAKPETADRESISGTYTAETGGYRPVSQPSAADKAELEKIRKELASAKAMVDSLQKTVARQRKFEEEISNLMRDRRIAEEKLALLEQRCRRLEEELAKPNAKIDELQKRLAAERMDTEKAAKRASAAEDKINRLEKLLREAGFAVNAVEKKLGEKEKELARFKKEYAELQSSRDMITADDRALRTKLQAAENKIRTLQEQIDALSGSKAFETAVKNAVETELGTEKKRVSELQQTLDAIGKKLKTSESALAAAEAESEKRKRELENADQDIKQLNEKLTEITERKNSLEKDVKTLAERSDALEKRLALRDTDDFRAAANARETCRKLEKDLLALQNELIELRNAANAKDTRTGDLERQLKSTSAELLATRTREIEFKDKLTAAEKRLAELQGASEKLAALQRNFDALSAENRENRALVAAAKPREAELERIKLRLLENDRLKGDLVREQQLNEELKSENIRNRNEIKTLRSRIAELDAARRKIAELEAATQELTRLKKLQEQYKVLEGREAELATLKIKLGELETTISNLRIVIKQNVERERENTKKISALVAENSAVLKLRERNSELAELVESQLKELDALNKKITRLESDSENRFAAEHKRELDALRAIIAQIGPLNDKLNKLRQEKQNMEDEFKRRINSLEQHRQAAETIIQRKDEELARLRKLNQELADYRKNSTAALRDRAELAKIERLENEVQALNKLNAELAAERDKVIAELEDRRRGLDSATSMVKINSSPEELASSGLLAENSGSIELALWNYRQALEADPDFSPAHLRLGLLLYNRKDFAGAMPHLSAARAANPDKIDLALKTARCQLELKRFGNARALVDPLLKKYPENYQVQLLAALSEAAAGATSRAEERLIAAARLAPEEPEVYIELARLLATQITDRSSEAVRAYERARELGAPPVPDLEKALASLLDHRRNLVNFLASAAGEAEVGGDWNSAIWYYKQLLDIKRDEYIPYLAFAQMKNGNGASARETLQFNTPSRLGMVVLTLLELESKDDTAALRAARQAAGAVIPEKWLGLKLEIERLSNIKRPGAALRMLLSGFKKSDPASAR